MEVWAKVNELAAQHHVIPIAVLVAFLWRIVRPFLVDGRSCFVELVAIGRALAKKHGVDEASIDAERPLAEKRIPEVPDVPAVVNGVASALRDSSSGIHS